MCLQVKNGKAFELRSVTEVSLDNRDWELGPISPRVVYSDVTS